MTTPTAEQRQMAAQLWNNLSGSYQHVAGDPDLFVRVMVKEINHIASALAAAEERGRQAGIAECVALVYGLADEHHKCSNDIFGRPDYEPGDMEDVAALEGSFGQSLDDAARACESLLSKP